MAREEKYGLRQRLYSACNRGLSTLMFAGIEKTEKAQRKRFSTDFLPESASFHFLVNIPKRSIHMEVVIDVPISSCRHSRFNTRKNRSSDDLKRLAERIKRNGFERTRALWAIHADDGMYEIFAGGTRFEAAREAGLDTIPILKHEGLTPEQISQKADIDNENDEYHTPVSIIDIWAEYARLRDEEKWTQERIAQVKGVNQSSVSERLKWHTVSEKIKNYIEQQLLDEGHLREITSISNVQYLSPWLTTHQVWEELADKVVSDKGKNGEKSVRSVRKDVVVWKEFIDYAVQIFESLPELVTLYDLVSGREPIPYEYKARDKFIQILADQKARALVKVKSAEQSIRVHIAANLEAYKTFIDHKTSQAAQEVERISREQLLLSKFSHGDSIDILQQSWRCGSIRLLLTDPPYGMEYQSNRRRKSKAPQVIQGDHSKDEALALITSMLKAAVPHLAQDAHVLIFCNWEMEPQVRKAIAENDLEIKGSLVWVKENHSAGDVRGAFAPRHERIIHAVKGNPEVTPRIPDVLEVPRSHETEHPNEKPVDLLKKLIESTTSEHDLVIDPFAGCASTLIASLKLNRNFWGAEIEEQFFEEGSARLLREANTNG